MDVKEKRKELKNKVLKYNLMLAQENINDEEKKYIRSKVSMLITKYLEL